MYQTILVTLDTTDADRTILDHVRPLASLRDNTELRPMPFLPGRRA